VEFATPLSHDEERIDACYDGEPLRYRMMEDLLGDQPVLRLVPHDLEGQLHLPMKAEMDAVEKNRTCELADLPRGHRAITLKWVFKLKRDEVGAIIKHNARLVARCFLQREGIDFDDAFASVSRFMQRPTTEHQQAMKRIIRYVTGTLDHGLYYSRCPGEAHLVRYSDSDHADDIDTSKSMRVILFFFGKCLVSWQ
jgi:hypothetical protein